MDMQKDLETNRIPIEELPDCWMQYYGTIFCERCPVGKLCAEMKAWDDIE
jgi:hypothetical protein